MGWLRDLMSSAKPPLGSFGELARAARYSAAWPTTEAIQPRSLATLLSKLDHNEQLLWLADRPSIQGVLADVLSTSVEALQRPLRAGLEGEIVESGHLRLDDVPRARPLELAREPLPPAIPERVQRPDGPALWWVAPAGAGRSLCGRWLKARGRAEFVAATRWDEVENLPDGPVYVELRESGAAEPTARPGLCIAAPFTPRRAGFEVVSSPPPSEWLDALLGWVQARLPSDTRLADSASKALLLERIANEELRTLGELLGWIGLVDELGPREAGRPVDRLARRFVERRVLATLEPSSPYAAWIRRSIYPLLLGLVERVFSDSDRPLSAARSFEEWMALVPPEVERSADVEWMRLSLSRIETPLRPADLDRAARQLPPGAFRVITTLERAGILASEDDGHLELAPAWLRSALSRQAISALIARSPFEWGEALLRAHAAPLLARALLERTRNLGGSALEPVLDLDAEEQPAYAAAVDLAFRVAGVARLLGADIGAEVLEGLLGEAARLAVELEPRLPLPRIDLSAGMEDLVSPNQDAGALLHTGTFFLAALSVTELAGTARTRLGVLDPWHATRAEPALAAVYDAIENALASRPAWRTATYSLVMRARRVVGNARDPERPHSLERPAQILDEIEHGVLSWETIGGDDTSWLEPHLELAAERDVPEATLASAIWAAWDHAHGPDGAAFLAPISLTHALFWRYVPDELLQRLLVHGGRRGVPYEVFGIEQWGAFVRALEQNPELIGDAAAWAHMPASLGLGLLAAELPWDLATNSLTVLWRRFPNELRSAVRAQLAGARGGTTESLRALLAALPAEGSSELLAELGESALASKIVPSAVAPLRQFLHRLIRDRTPSWRDAYDLLSKLERELRRVSSA